MAAFGPISCGCRAGSLDTTWLPFFFHIKQVRKHIFIEGIQNITESPFCNRFISENRMILGATTFHLIGVQSLVPFHHISCKWSSLRRGYEWEWFQEERVSGTHHSNVPSGTKMCQGTWDWWLGKRVSWRVYGHRSWREGMGCHVTDL